MSDNSSTNCFNTRPYGLVSLAHLTPMTTTIIDKTVFLISGTAVFGGSGAYTTTRNDCPAPGVQVCVVQQGAANGEQTCTTTNADGYYALSVPLFSNVVVSATYTTGSKEHSMSAPHTLSMDADKPNR
jgi:hypothetical protein